VEFPEAFVVGAQFFVNFRYTCYRRSTVIPINKNELVESGNKNVNPLRGHSRYRVQTFSGLANDDFKFYKLADRWYHCNDLKRKNKITKTASIILCIFLQILKWWSFIKILNVASIKLEIIWMQVRRIWILIIKIIILYNIKIPPKMKMEYNFIIFYIQFYKKILKNRIQLYFIYNYKEKNSKRFLIV